MSPYLLVIKNVIPSLYSTVQAILIEVNYFGTELFILKQMGLLRTFEAQMQEDLPAMNSPIEDSYAIDNRLLNSQRAQAYWVHC